MHYLDLYTLFYIHFQVVAITPVMYKKYSKFDLKLLLFIFIISALVKF